MKRYKNNCFFIIVILICFFCNVSDFNSRRIECFAKHEHENRPIAAMIGNSFKERDIQKGLGEADIIYEIPVEYPFTRLMALFLNPEEKDIVIGPIRSSRYYFSRICSEWSAIFIHCGGQSLKNEKVLDLDEMNFPLLYWRDNKIGGWINLFTSIKKIRENTDSLNKLMEKFGNNKSLIRNAEIINSDSKNVSKISIKYNSDYQVNYEYSKDDKLYFRYVNQRPHMDNNDLIPINASSIIIQHVPVEKIEDDLEGRLDIKLVGEGIARIFQNGIQRVVRWEKQNINERTVFYLNNENEEINFQDGNIWIHLVPSDIEIWLK